MPRRDLTEHLLNPFELDEKQQQEARCIDMEKSTLRLDPNRTALMRFGSRFCKHGYEQQKSASSSLGTHPPTPLLPALTLSAGEYRVSGGELKVSRQMGLPRNPHARRPKPKMASLYFWRPPVVEPWWSHRCPTPT